MTGSSPVVSVPGLRQLPTTNRVVKSEFINDKCALRIGLISHSCPLKSLPDTSWILSESYMAPLIELPGEANPLSRQNVFNALLSAAGTTQHQIQTGGQQLQNWERQENYYSLLQVCNIHFGFSQKHYD